MTLLGRFLFSGEDVDKKVAVLSGGERTRLALAKMLVSPANMLCLDEPTNHLDIQSRDVLEDALVEYPGSMLLITHDRHLIRSIADRIVEVIHGKVTVYDGNYEYYLATREPEEDAAVTTEDEVGPSVSAKERRRLGAEHRARTKGARDRVKKTEAELEEIAAERTRIEGVLADPESYTKGEDIAALSERYERIKKKAAALEADWLEATSELEAAGDAP